MTDTTVDVEDSRSQFPTCDSILSENWKQITFNIQFELYSGTSQSMLLQIIQLISTITTSLIQPNRILTANDLVDEFHVCTLNWFLFEQKLKKKMIQWWLRDDSILCWNRK